MCLQDTDVSHKFTLEFKCELDIHTLGNTYPGALIDLLTSIEIFNQMAISLLFLV